MLEQIAKAVVDDIGDKNSNGEERGQLYNRFKSDGRNQPFVPLAGVQVTGAEQNGKYRQQQGDIKRGVTQDRKFGKTE